MKFIVTFKGRKLVECLAENVKSYHYNEKFALASGKLKIVKIFGDGFGYVSCNTRYNLFGLLEASEFKNVRKDTPEMEKIHVDKSSGYFIAKLKNS